MSPMPQLPQIKQPPMTTQTVSSSQVTKLPGLAPKNMKDPKKVAQQLKNGEVRAQTLDMLKFNENGQWSLHKVDDPK